MSSDAFSDYVVGHGELWSAKLLTLCCKQLGADVAFMDTRDVMVVTPTADGTSVDLNEDTSNDKVWGQRTAGVTCNMNYVGREPERNARAGAVTPPMGGGVPVVGDL